MSAHNSASDIDLHALTILVLADSLGTSPPDLFVDTLLRLAADGLVNIGSAGKLEVTDAGRHAAEEYWTSHEPPRGVPVSSVSAATPSERVACALH